ncbi:unnamed protein product [Brassica oleracea]|uniref:(rape) hypothetical protein n=1 Tax=Brassica napus TaxID=3708 RepID=A0A816JQJ3_BRANA|nr:unnamed protein product [Brassica napus]
MEENRRSSRVRREVPVVGGENTIEWINISVPSPSDDKRSVVLPSPEENYASSSRVIGEPPISFAWRINQTSPNVLELLPISSMFPLTGIRLAFAHSLCHFAFPFVAQEVTGESTISVFHWWENFCSTYLGHWRNNNEPRTLLVQSDGIGLIRNKSVSLFFSLKKAEHSLGGLSSEHSNLTSLGSEMSHSEHEILLEVLNCTLKISKQLGTAPYAMYFESVTGKPVISSDETFGGLVNILESGYDMFIGQRTWSDLCADISREKELKSHENLRTFSIDMLLSLSTLCQKAGSWEKVFTIIENHLQHRLVPKKFRYNNNGEALSDICSSILVQATSQFAKVMFESAFDIVLLLSYLLNISAQVSMSQQDISKLRLKLLPMIQDIVSQWLIILFFVNTPTSVDDCSFKLSSLQIDSSIDKKSWNKMLGKCGFSLAYILLFSDHRRCIVDSQFNLRYLPDSEITTSLVQNFVSWICYSKTGEDSSSLLRRSSELTLRLIRNGQADAVERILEVVEGSLRGEKTFGHGQDSSGDWCLLQHLRGCCLLDQVQRGACGI